MGVCRIDVQAPSAAPPAAVYALLRDGATWPSWSSIDSCEIERPGADEPEGVGAVRVFRRGRTVGRDEITELVPDRRFGYRHVRGLPVRDYQASVEVTPQEGGCLIRWRASFRPAVPGTGWLMRRGIGQFLDECVRGLAGYAASHGAAQP